VAGEGAPIAALAAVAAARTVAAGTARLFCALSEVSAVPEAQDRRGEGVADFAARRTRVLQVALVNERFTAEFVQRYDGGLDVGELSQPQEMICDGGSAYVRVADRWTGFFIDDPGGPRSLNDPLWPLDALFGARDDAVDIGREAVRGVPATRCRLTLDLARADAALPAGVTVPGGPYRALRALPAEVWLDAAGLARRVAVSADPVTAARGEQAWTIIELWDFGVAVDITPPPPDQVVSPQDAYQNARRSDP
jgi:hypothetical protein